jgi:uncharacterized cupredoxin-like copper-binding protein
MKKIMTTIMLVSAILVTGCASHDNDDGHHAAKSTHHSEMMGDGHGSNTEQSHHDQMKSHEHGMGSITGAPGKLGRVSRTINITADDSMRFIHEPLNILDGETIRFVVTNKGAIAHEFSIATKGEHMAHGEMMKNNPSMHHAPGGNVITIKSGQTEELIWSFGNALEIEAACNIPGHYEAGMHSPVTIQGK